MILYLILPSIYSFILRIFGSFLFRKNYEKTKEAIDKFVLTSISWGIKICFFYILSVGAIYLNSLNNLEISSKSSI